MFFLEAKRAASVLGWVVKEMESRYRLMTREGVRNIDGYNAKHTLPMPYIVVIVDEMSDLMLVAGNVAKDLGVEDAFRLVVNNGSGAQQTVFHLHIHLIAGRELNWPPG